MPKKKANPTDQAKETKKKEAKNHPMTAEEEQKERERLLKIALKKRPTRVNIGASAESREDSTPS